MSEIDEKKGMQQFTCKLKPETKDALGQLINSGDFNTANQMMETLIEAYNFPKKANEKNANELQELTEKYDLLNGIHTQLIEEFKQYKANNTSNSATIADLQQQLEAAKSNIPSDGSLIVPVTSLQLALLRWVCQRENKKHNRNDITPSLLLLYIFDVMLLEGDKFAVNSVPDRVISELKQRLES